MLVGDLQMEMRVCLFWALVANEMGREVDKLSGWCEFLLCIKFVPLELGNVLSAWRFRKGEGKGS
jgi:hypothetical protein